MNLVIAISIKSMQIISLSEKHITFVHERVTRNANQGRTQQMAKLPSHYLKIW